MSATNCACPCPDPTVTEIPGAPGVDGASGADGANGVNAYTVTTTASFNLPGAPGPTGLVNVAVSSWMVVGQIIWISDALGTAMGTFKVLTIPSSTGVTLNWLQYPDDSAPGTPITVGSGVTPSGIIPTFTPPADLTNNTTGAAVAALAAGVGILNLSFNHTWVNNTLAVEPVTNFVLGFKFKIISWAFVTDQILTGGGGSRVCNMEIQTTDVGTVPSTCTVTTAGAATQGTVVAATAVAGANTGSATDSVSIEVAAGGTAITGGSGQFIIVVQNMDIADAITSLNNSVTSINATL